MVSKNKKSLVSVIMPFYKNLSLLKKSLKSVLQQSYTNYEIILINDNPKKNLNSALIKYYNFHMINLNNHC